MSRGNLNGGGRVGVYQVTQPPRPPRRFVTLTTPTFGDHHPSTVVPFASRIGPYAHHTPSTTTATDHHMTTENTRPTRTPTRAATTTTTERPTTATRNDAFAAGVVLGAAAGIVAGYALAEPTRPRVYVRDTSLFHHVRG